MKFSEIFTLLRNNLGGGFFDPIMFKDGRLAPVPATMELYKDSTQTLYDIDRKGSGSISTSEAGKQFWALIDAADNKSWKWGYMGGDLQPQLMQLASQMMFPTYRQFCNQYMTAKCLSIVNADAKLTTNFLYAVYNGVLFFEYFAGALKVYVETQGITDPAILIEKMLYERRSLDPTKWSANTVSLLKQGADTLEKILPQVSGSVTFDIEI